MHRRTRFVLFSLAVAFVLSSESRTHGADAFDITQPLRVVTEDGKKLRGGLVDAATSTSWLWLRYGRSPNTIRQRVDWREIATLEQNQHKVAPGTVRAAAAELAATTPSPIKVVASILEAPASRQPTKPQVAAPRLSATNRRSGRRVAQLHIDAHLANWDPGVENDGLQLTLRASDAEGKPVAVGGTLDVELLAQRHTPYHHAPRDRGLQLNRVGRWKLAVHREDFLAGSFDATLPFQAAHPELDTTWSPYGLIHVRLVIPGHGVTERSVDGVRIRPFAPTRDAIELKTGRRFLSSEPIDRARRRSS